MAYSTLPIAGVDLVDTQTAAELALNGTTSPTFGPLGTQTFANDGKRYVFAKATVAIAASTATIVVNASTFAATLGAGSYFTATSMASGDYGWFAIASV
jgi:hypothetical protein